VVGRCRPGDFFSLFDSLPEFEMVLTGPVKPFNRFCWVLGHANSSFATQVADVSAYQD
jgi:hypothetical protein